MGLRFVPFLFGNHTIVVKVIDAQIRFFSQFCCRLGFEPLIFGGLNLLFTRTIFCFLSQCPRGFLASDRLFQLGINFRAE
ncbi:Uncharacterised protein [Vibrio cholerae]|nr:Uncharacterised protein [Vibrio cholerae]